MIQRKSAVLIYCCAIFFCSVLFQGVSPTWSTNSNRLSTRLFDVKERDGFTVISDNLLDVTGQIDMPGKSVKSEEQKQATQPTPNQPTPQPSSAATLDKQITNSSTLSPLVDQIPQRSKTLPKNKVHMVKIYGNDTLQYYYMNLMVGNPPQQQSVIIDTGSDTTAFPCSIN